MLRLKGDLIGNLAVLPPRFVVLIEPGLRQIETTVKERGSLATCIAQKDTCLAVILFPGVSAPLRRYTSRMLPMFGKVGAINEKHPILFP